MAPLQIIDQYYLTITFLISLALQGSLFLISFTFQTDKFTDVGGSANFFLLALFTLLVGQSFSTRNILVSVLVMLWSLRLGGFLLYRVLKTGHDGRFDEMRSQFFKFMGFWAFQLFWVWIVSLPVTILNSPAVTVMSDEILALGGGMVEFGTSRDIAGLIMWTIGFLIEVVGDQQKFNYKFSQPPKGSIMNKGIWNYTRHPNFFGEILLWWGMWILCLSPALSSTISKKGRMALYGAVVSPIFITLLLFFVSGLPLAEKPTAERYFMMSKGKIPLPGDKWGDYQSYLDKTSILIPFPPALYKPLPVIIKRTLFLDFEMFQFDEKVDGKLALEKEAKRSEENA